MTAAKLQSRLEELTEAGRELASQDAVLNRELTALRTDSALGRLDDFGEDRMALLRGEAANLADTMRENARLKRLTQADLSRARAAESVEKERQEHVTALKARDEAGLHMPGAVAELQEAAARYCALWSLANMEPGRIGAKVERVPPALNRHKLAADVEQIMSDFLESV